MDIPRLNAELLAYLGIHLEAEHWDLPEMKPRDTLVIRCDPSFADAIERWLSVDEHSFGYRIEQVEMPPF